MRFTMLSTLAAVALSLLSLDTHAAPVNRKFHPVVNDDPQNAHLNVQTPGADINQTISIKQEPGPDGQVIPAADTKVAACAIKDTNGDIDLSGGGSCWSPKAPAPTAEQQTIAASTIVRASSPAPHTASQTVRVPSLASVSATHAASASVAQAANVSASISAPHRAGHAVEVASVPALLPARRTETVRAAASSLPGKQLEPAVAADVTLTDFVRLRWLEFSLIALAAAMLLAIGIALIIRMGLGDLLRIRRPAETDEERAVRDGLIAAPAVVHDPLISPRGR